MRIPIPYRQFDKLIEQETFESTFTWGMRMAVSATMPIIWGVATGRIAEATWMGLAAEGICFVELKGSFNQGIRILIAGILLTAIFTALGTITALSIGLSVLGMLLVGFISGLFKNLGDRGSALSVSVFVVFIIANAFPVHSGAELYDRVLLVMAGGLWTLFVGAVITLLMPAREPYRRTVAIIWRSVASLTESVAKGWDGKALRSSARELYLKEKEVRTSIDTSFHFYESMAHQVSKDNKDEYQLAQVRKSTALIATHIISIAEELENLNIRETDSTLRVQLHDVLKVVQQLIERVAVFVITLKPEDELLIFSRIRRLQTLLSVLKEYPFEEGAKVTTSVKRVIQLIERFVKLTESTITRLQDMGKDMPVFRSYSLFKTLFILHPRHWIKNIQLLFNFNTFTTRYALRTALAASAAIFISKWFNIDHGYWIPFTVIIVSQPYFGATLKKAIDRVVGTVLGGIAGSVLLKLQLGVAIEIAMLFTSFVFIIYYLRSRYSVSAFFITVSLILLFNIEMPVSETLIFTRAFSTIGGAALAIAAGFMLLPTWDKKWLPIYLSRAICFNYEYFIRTFYTADNKDWTKYKRNAESNNSNAFDSFSRYIEEPGSKSRIYALYYQLITHNVRITRELNNINLERDNIATTTNTVNLQSADKRLEICLYWFRQNIRLVKQIDPDNNAETDKSLEPVLQSISKEQLLYIDRMIVELKAMNPELEKLVNRTHQPEQK